MQNSEFRIIAAAGHLLPTTWLPGHRKEIKIPVTLRTAT